MSKFRTSSFFWTSFSDLMTSLFFVMLVLFVLTIALLHKKMVATQEQIDKIKEIEQALTRIDTAYFDYNSVYKKHNLKIKVNFPVGVSDINVIDKRTQDELRNAGQSIQDSIIKISQEHNEIQYLLAIEGQASRDNYPHNFQLSYERALALSRFWSENNIDFGANCEVLISGSGTGGTMREHEERLNQRFLIHIIPKPGIIEYGKQIVQ